MLKPPQALMCCILLTAAARVLAADSAPAPYTGPEWAPLAQGPVLQAAAGITPSLYPDSDSATVDEKTMETYQTDGTGQNQDETYTKVLTEKGRRDNGVMRLGFLLPYFKVEVARLEVIKPDGKVITVDVAANSKESIDNHQMEENIYDPNSRILEVNVPGVEIGDIVHSITRNTTAKAIIPGEFGDEFLFEARGFVRHISCEIRAPAAKPLSNIRLRDEVKGTVTATTTTEADGTVVHHWEIAQVPRIYDEPNMPPDEMVLQRLVVSTLPDWQAVSQWYWNLSTSHLDATTPEMKTTVATLTLGDKTDQEKMDALFQYVSGSIRYMGVTPEKDSPGFEPHDVKLTFAKKYGVCRDKAALLVSMLNIAGLQAYPVLINVGTRLDPEVPNPFFNHAIVAVKTAQGNYILMDPTDEHTRTLLPAYDDHQSYLVCEPKGYTLMLSPVTSPAENMMRITTTGVLGDDGQLTATAKLEFMGVNDDEYRGALEQMKPDDRRRFFAGRLQKIMPGAELTALKITPENILDESTPLRAEVTFTVARMAGFGGDAAVVSMPWLGRSFGVANYILDGTGLEKRHYPLETEVTCGVTEQVAIKVGANFAHSLSLPTSSQVDDEGVSYQRQFDFGDQTLTASRKLALKVVEFSPTQYLGLKQMLRNVAMDERKLPVLATATAAPAALASLANLGALPPVESDARIITDDHQITVSDAHHSVEEVHYVKMVLTYAGKISESEVKIPYNPATESVKLIHAWVTSPAGQRQEVSADETNVMDAEWNPSAKRYTGGKVLVDSLPGVEIGSTIDVAFEITLKDAPYLSDFEPFQLADAFDEKSLQLTAPAGLAIKLRQSGPPGGMTQKMQGINGATLDTWKAEKISALAAEEGTPPDWSYRAGVAYYVGDPADYLKELNTAMLAHAAHATKASALAKSLADGAKTRLDGLRAIRDEVAKTVRAAGPNFTELPLAELSDADTTLTDGYGHAADRAILLHAMLTAAGFAPQLVLASQLPPLPALAEVARSFPLPDEFSTPLVRVEVDGQTYYLNDTDQYARLGTTAHDDRLGLVLATSAYDTIKAAPDCRTHVATTYTLTIGDDGNARLGIRHEYTGLAYAENNRHYAELRPEERAHFYQELVASVAQGARPAGELTTNFISYPGVEEFSVEVSNYGIADGKFLYLNLPATPPLFHTATDRRSLPLFIEDDADDTIHTVVKLPPDHSRVVIAPVSVELKGPDGAGSARLTATNAKGEFDMTYVLDRHPAVIKIEDYAGAFLTESALENRAGRVLLLETTAP